MKSAVKETKSAKVRKPIYKRWYVWVLAALVIGAAASNNGNEATTQPTIEVTLATVTTVEVPSTSLLDSAAGVLMEHFVEDVLEDEYHKAQRSTFQPAYTNDEHTAGELVTKYEGVGYTLKLHTEWGVQEDSTNKMAVVLAELYTGNEVYEIDLSQIPSNYIAVTF